MSGRDSIISRSVQIAFVAILLGAWHFAAETGSVMSLFLPPLPLVWKAMQGLVESGQLWAAFKVTALTIARAYTAAAAAGILVGFIIGRSDWLIRVLEPVLSGMFAIPIALFFPLFILFFGIGTASKVAFGAVYGFFPIALNTIAGFSSVEQHLLSAMYSMGAGPAQQFRYVYLPGALPVIVTGLRIGFFICFAAVLGGETLSSLSGMGHNIAYSAELMDAAKMYAWVGFVVLTTIIFNLLLSAAESRAGHR